MMLLKASLGSGDYTVGYEIQRSHDFKALDPKLPLIQHLNKS